MKGLVLVAFLALATVGAENNVKFFVTLPKGAGLGSDLTKIEVHGCSCPDTFTPKLHETFSSRQKALETFKNSCECINCLDDESETCHKLRGFPFLIRNELVESDRNVNILIYDEEKPLLHRQRRGLLKQFFDRFGGGISLKHNQESRADLNLGINDNNDKVNSNNKDLEPSNGSLLPSLGNLTMKLD